MRIGPFLDLLKTSSIEWWNDNTFRLAASLAFYTVFSLAPVIVIAVAIAGLVFDQEQATHQITHEIEMLIGPQGGKAVRQLSMDMEAIGTSRTAALIGIVTLIVGSTVVFAELQSALNHIWDVKADPHRGFWASLIRERARSFAIVLGVGFLLLVSLVLSAGLSAAETYMDGRITNLAWLWQVLHTAGSFVIVSLLFAMIYRYLPDVRLTWRDVTIGSAVTALLFTAGKYLIGLYLGRMALGSTYGAAGSFAVLLIWVYYSALICFYGAEFTSVYARRYGSRIHPEPHAVRVGDKPNSV
ncbi:MAG: serum resistance protein BrkB [Phycisphaerae bacterium]